MRQGPGTMTLGIITTLAALLLGNSPTPAPAWTFEAGEKEPNSALEILVLRPDLQGVRIIELFEGLDYPHPAAALSAWKRSAGDGPPRSLGKPLEAGLAALNPLMVEELRLLHEARVVIGFDEHGDPSWWVTLPEDDGTISALAGALILTEGGPEPPMEGVRVDRLGPPGAPLLAEVGGVVTLAGSRQALAEALGQRLFEIVEPEPLDPNGPQRLDSGWVLQLDPQGLTDARSLDLRRLAEGLLGFGCLGFEAVATLKADALVMTVNGRFGPQWPAKGVEAIDPGWLDWIPAERTAAALALTFDPSPEVWNMTFAAADRAERADPLRAEVAPLRSRINLIALLAGIRPEVDLWPRLAGVSVSVSVDEAREIDGLLIALHARSESAAGRIADRVMPRMAIALGALPEAEGGRVDGEAGRSLGRLSGRPIRVWRRGTTVLTAWGDGLLEAAQAARVDPARSAGPLIRKSWGDSPPPRAGAFWPGRWPGLAPAGSALEAALEDAPPVLWWGRNDGPTTRDEVRWPGLQGTIGRLLDRLPIDPATSRS